MKAPERIHQHLRASQDLVELFGYLAERNETAARLFLKEVRTAYELILRVPGIGRRWESATAKIKDLRVTFVSKRFHDYLIVYRRVSDGVEVVTLVHGARDLGPLIDSLPDDGPAAVQGG